MNEYANDNHQVKIERFPGELRNQRVVGYEGFRNSLSRRELFPVLFIEECIAVVTPRYAGLLASFIEAPSEKRQLAQQLESAVRVLEIVKNERDEMGVSEFYTLYSHACVALLKSVEGIQRSLPLLAQEYPDSEEMQRLVQVMESGIDQLRVGLTQKGALFDYRIKSARDSFALAGILFQKMQDNIFPHPAGKPTSLKDRCKEAVVFYGKVCEAYISAIRRAKV